MAKRQSERAGERERERERERECVTYSSAALILGLERRDAEDERRQDAARDGCHPVDPHVVDLRPEASLASQREGVDEHGSVPVGTGEEPEAAAR